MQINITSILYKASVLDYALVPVCLGMLAYTGNWLWGASAAVSALAAYYKPLPRLHRWMMRRLLRSYH